VALLVIAPAARPRTAAVLPHHYYSSPTAQHCRRESEGWCCACSVSRHWHARAMQTDIQIHIPFPESSHLTTNHHHHRTCPFSWRQMAIHTAFNNRQARYASHQHQPYRRRRRSLVASKTQPRATWFDSHDFFSLLFIFFATKQRVRRGITSSQNHGQHVANAAPRAHLTEKPDLLLACLRPPPLGRSSGHDCDRHPNTTNQIRGFS
jgi:hypothetical protein